ncbi:MAG: endonuclease/exonuclease/phosphatase family protein [Kiritimatiellae bacterium]|nr:endonuclease/exonuclease/phosphatase family protein [Kiritimatiellia bacterium]
MHGAMLLLAGIVVGTWNGNWFPSGRAEHRAHPDVEEATSFAAAKMLATGLEAVDPARTNDVILCLNEIRGPRAASNLIARIGRSGLRLVSISAYRRRDRFDQQQDVIAATLPVAEAHWCKWKVVKNIFPPRGYAFAAVILAPAVTANVYAVHLKSDYGVTTPEIASANREKRSAAVSQLIDAERPKRFRPLRPVIIAGDMNADKWGRNELSRELFNALDKNGFSDALTLLPPDRRGTHPSRRYGNSALDYIFFRGLSASNPPRIIPNEGLSDHYAVFALLEFHNSIR